MSITKPQFLQFKKKIEEAPYSKKNITVSKNSNISYLYYRIRRPIFKLRYKRYQKANPTHPWLTPDAISLLEQLLNKDMLGLEYGSGGSTSFFSKRLKHLVSVEHNSEWFDQVTNMLNNLNLNNVNLNLLRPDVANPMPKLSSENDVLITSDDYPVKDSCYKSYADFIDTFQNDSFDFILIDGRARVSCSFKAFDKLKSGGLFVLDNSERRRYNEIHKALENWPSINTTTGLTDTKIWRKP